MASRPYQAQVSPGGTQALGQASAQAFGAGVGDAISSVGAAVEQYDHVQRQLKRNEDNAAFGKAFSDYRLAVDRDVRSYQEEAQPGAAGHEDSVRTYLDANGQKLLDGIADPRVRQQAEVQVHEFNNAQLGREEQWAGAQRVAKVAVDEKTTQDGDGLRFSTATSIEDVNAWGLENDKAAIARIDAYGNLNGDQKAKLLAAHYASQDKAKLVAAIRINPVAAKQMLTAGAFPHLDADDAEAGIVRADASLAREEAARRRDEAAAKVDARQTLTTRQAELDGGAGDPQDWYDLAKGYEAIGDGDAAVRAKRRGTEMRAALTHRGDPLPELDAKIGALDAREAQGGLTTEQAAERAGLQSERRTQASLLGQTGGAMQAYARATNRPLQPIDWNDPVQVKGRASFARQAAQTYGKPFEPLTQGDIDQFRDDMAAGPGGKRQVLDRLAGLGDATAVLNAARQLSGPGDSAFLMAARVLSYPAGKSLAGDILNGHEVRRKAPWQDASLAKARNDFGGWYRGVLRHLPPDYRNDLFEASLDFYAARSNGGTYDAGRFAEATETLMGRSGAGGGLARMKRSVVIAPPTMKPADMMTRFARASGDEYRAAAGGRAPRGADGAPFTRGEFRALVPTLLDDGRYGFRGVNGELVRDERGGTYAVDLWRLPAR